jgi:hypothetical protein
MAKCFQCRLLGSGLFPAPWLWHFQFERPNITPGTVWPWHIALAFSAAHIRVSGVNDRAVRKQCMREGGSAVVLRRHKAQLVSVTQLPAVLFWKD